MAMQEIEKLAKEYAEAESRLQRHVRSYNDGVEAVRRKYLPAIRANVSRLEDAKERLHDALEESPELFTKKKTATFHGVRCGWKKLKGKVSWQSKEKVLKLIHKLFPDRAKGLIRLEESPDKEALAKLSAQELKKLGVTVIHDGDAPYIKLMDSEGEKIVKEFLKGFENGKEAA